MDRFGDENLKDPVIDISALLDRSDSPGMSFVELIRASITLFSADFDDASEGFASSDHINSDSAISDSDSVVSQDSQASTVSVNPVSSQ